MPALRVPGRLMPPGEWRVILGGIGGGVVLSVIVGVVLALAPVDLRGASAVVSGAGAALTGFALGYVLSDL